MAATSSGRMQSRELAVDYNGHVTARLAGGESSAVTLVVPGPDGLPTPDGFHRQLIKMVAGLSDAAGASIVRPVCDETLGWQWVIEPL